MLHFGQINDAIWRAWLYATQTRSLAIFFGIGFAILAVTLLIASRTRWGKAKPLTKCVALSVLAHVWLLMYVLGSRAVLPQGSPQGVDTNMSIAFEVDQSNFPASALPLTPADEEPATDSGEPQAWERSVSLADLPKPAELQAALAQSFLAAPQLLPHNDPTPMPALPPEAVALEESTVSAPDFLASEHNSPAESRDGAVEPPPFMSLPVAPPEPFVLPPAGDSSNTSGAMSRLADSSMTPSPNLIKNASVDHSPILPPEQQLPKDSRLPVDYQLRQAPNRLQLATPFGADADSEAAVDAGLTWLAAAQSPDGSWNAKQFGAGTETYALGESRYGTGDRADTGVGGLALLAFLSAGHTHLEGKYRTTVQLGLQFLLRAQMPSGDLSGPKQVGSERSVLNARMYCHSIATLALAEAYAMTGDVMLRDALLRAAQYSINAQDPRGGGWRYRPRDPGDLSQFGWQAMALRSVARSGIEVPNDVRVGMLGFLDSCAAGATGGLATYRPKEGRPSETMTAESLACRLLLDHPSTAAAQQEALNMIMSHLPGVGEDNVYFWYYATLALFQLQDHNWRQWNQAMKRQLLITQTPVYREQAGSWPPDRMWGGYGGRVYSTAMSCLCLEVYYRYLPMYQRANVARVPLGDRTNR